MKYTVHKYMQWYSELRDKGEVPCETLEEALAECKKWITENHGRVTIVVHEPRVIYEAKNLE